MSKKIFQIIILLTLVLASFAGAGKAEAWSGCGSTYAVQWGDTLSGIAARCGTTMAALWQDNPGLGSWVYAGQVLAMPGGGSWYSDSGGYAIHIVARGDTLKIIAARFGTTLNNLLALNPGITNPDVIYVGQLIRIR